MDLYLSGKEAYLTKLSVQGKRDAAYSADDICVNYTTEGQVTPGISSCTVIRLRFYSFKMDKKYHKDGSLKYMFVKFEI